MKKYFLFAAVAGMLVSCSSESLTGSDPKIEPTQDDRVPIEITVASPEVKGTTRSVGTVGDVAGASNVWKGEKVNVFMFTKADDGSSTLNLTEDEPGSGIYLYNDVALTTPNGNAFGIANELNAAGDRITYKYYPGSGNFDFWGYYKDDANAVDDPATTDVDESAIDYGSAAVKVPFKIIGCQDLMVAKAEPTAAQQAIIADDAFGTNKNRYYSAFAARKGIQPDMTFKHLLTRFTFSVVGKNNAACGFNSGGSLPGTGEYKGVFIKSIKVKSKETGNIIAAYTGTAKPTKDLIEFTGNPGMLPLSGASDGTKVDSLYDQTIFTAANWANNTFMTSALTIGGANWTKILRPTSTTTPNPIGGALLVQPLVTDGETTYDLEVVLGQLLLVEDSYPTSGTSPVYEVRYYTAKDVITPTKVSVTWGDDTYNTTQGVSYNVNITVNGFEKIEITTTLEPWATGAPIAFEAE